ncbi:MAG: von Willebrand factor type A domain-containing protein, partial [Verrucomicrobia bacterium]|nr:von Willebrand factor type A domain-containing protein [Verrucomicrobiota bacterium]
EIKDVSKQGKAEEKEKVTWGYGVAGTVLGDDSGYAGRGFADKSTSDGLPVNQPVDSLNGDSALLGEDLSRKSDRLGFDDNLTITAGTKSSLELDPVVDRLKSLDEMDRVPERLAEREPAGFNPYVLAVENAFSTFSIDVDTAAYGLARQQLFAGGLPVPETVRTEEFINSFDYDYRPPAGKQTFAVHSEMAPSPFRTGMDLLKVGIKGYRIGRDNHRGAVLTLVIDTSGSMSTPERMGLVKKSLALLLDGLGPEDEVALVQFGGEARLVLEHTPLVQKAELLKAIAKLQPGGPTQFDAGLELGYAMATAGFKAGASNRIIIMSDGVANVGELDPEAMLQKVGEHRRKGIYLSVLGFGAGTYDDDLMERLANRGDGMYAYIDTLDEARRLLVDRLAATLHVIASDVKIQIEFNPDRVLRYRQLGYENRQLTKEQFRDDTVDAGEVGSGQAVTALYDLELDPNGESRDPIATVYVRYRRADTGAIEEISSRVTDSARRKRFADADARFQLAACTAEFAERLRRSPYADGTEMVDILGKLQPVAAELDLDAQVQELLRLILIADGLGK